MLEKTPFFSAVIPVYNKGPHVARAIQSVLAQTFEDFELLLINDASTDNSLAEMQKFSDSRIRILHRDTPGPGGYAARNLGIREARAEWVAFLDADDEWYPEHLEKMHEMIHQFPDVKFFSCGWETREWGQTFLNQYYLDHQSLGQHRIDCLQYLTLSSHGSRPVWTCVAVFNRNIPFSSTLFPEEEKVKCGGDLHAWLKLICCLKTMAWSPHIGSRYNRDSVNMVTKSAPASHILMSKSSFNKLSTHLNASEKIALKKELNRNLLTAWLENIERKHNNFSLPFKFFWSTDLYFLCKWSFLSFLPTSAFISARRLKQVLSKKHGTKIS